MTRENCPKASAEQNPTSLQGSYRFEPKLGFLMTLFVGAHISYGKGVTVVIIKVEQSCDFAILPPHQLLRSFSVKNRYNELPHALGLICRPYQSCLNLLPREV